MVSKRANQTLSKNRYEAAPRSSPRSSISIDRQTVINGNAIAERYGQRLPNYLRTHFNALLMDFTPKERRQMGLQPVDVKGVVIEK